MLKLLYRILLSFSSTVWIIVIFGFQQNWHWGKCPRWGVDVILMLIPVVISFVSLKLVKPFSTIEDSRFQAAEIELADNEFLPTYLGYFFVALGINDYYVLVPVFIIILIFVCASQRHYFNPVFLFFGYHFYYVTTQRGTRILVIIKGKVINRTADLDLVTMRRINDTTFISQRGD